MNEKLNPPIPVPTPAHRFGRRGLRHLRIRDRRSLDAFVRGAEAIPGTHPGELNSLVRDAEAMRPEVLTDLRTRTEALQTQWEQLASEDRLPVAEWLESICLPWIQARVPLRGNGLAPNWAFDFVLRVLEDYDASGSVLETVDPGWTRRSRGSEDASTLTRVAVAAGWMSWSHLIVDPTLSEAALTVLAELMDQIEELAHTRPSTFDEADKAWARAALILEGRLARHWRPDNRPVH